MKIALVQAWRRSPGAAVSRDTAAAVQVFHGRRWFTFCLWFLAAALLALALATTLLGWLALVLMGLPALISAYACLTIGWGEAIARVEMRDSGFSLRLPRYRGYFPFWPAQRLTGKWSDVIWLGRRRVRARILGIPFDYIAHGIETQGSRVVLLQPQPNDLSRDTRSMALNLPVDAIAAEFAARTGIIPHHESEISGGGLWRNLLFGGPDFTQASS